MKSGVLIIVSVLLVFGNVHGEPDSMCPPGHVMDFLRRVCWRNIIGCKATLSQWPMDELRVQNSLGGAFGDDRQMEKDQSTQSVEVSGQRDPKDGDTDLNNYLYRSQTPGLSVVSQDSEQNTQLFEFSQENGAQLEQTTTESTDEESSRNKSGEGQNDEDRDVDKQLNELSILIDSDQVNRVHAECAAEVESLRKNMISLKSLAEEREQFTTALMNRITFLQNEQQDHISLLSDQNTLLENQIEEVETERANRLECEVARDEAAAKISELQDKLDSTIQENDDLKEAIQEQSGLFEKKDQQIAMRNSIIKKLRAEIAAVMYDSTKYGESMEADVYY